MNKLIGSMALSIVSVPLIFGSAALAADFSAGKKVDNPPTSRSAMSSTNLKKATRTAATGRSDAANRAMMGDGKAPSYRMVVRSRDGAQRTIEPSQRVIDAARGMMRKTENGSREVIGRDNRQHVGDTTQYPNITVGLLESANSDPDLVYDCTATLIGPRIAITAANCVFDHGLDAGWIEDVAFWPAIDGENTVPFGSADWQEMYVPQEYIENFDGSYDSIWPYDVAIIVFSDPIGQDLGWMGYNSFPDLGDWDANLIGYGEGNEPWLQFYSKCKVQAKNMTDLDLLHSCDADYMSTGAAMYIYDKNEDSFTVAAIHEGAFDNQNWALRITEPLAQWIDDLNVN